MNPDRGGNFLDAPHSPDDDDSPLVIDPRTEGQVPLVRPAAPVPSPRGGAAPGGGGGAPEGGAGWPQQMRPSGGMHRGAGDPARRQGDTFGDGGFDRDRGRGRGSDGGEDYSKNNLPPVAEHELEFYIPDVLSYTAGQATRSPPKTVGNFRFRILMFPCGTHSTGGQQVSGFVEADPIEGLDPRWVFHGVKYQVSVVNWLDYRRTVTKVDTWTFSKDGIDRGWHDMVRTADLTQESGWLGPDNSIYIRACCYVRQGDSMNVSNDFNFKRDTGHIGLMNHGATCYMNGLLQSLFHNGEFRRIVYSLENEEVDTPDTPGKEDKEMLDASVLSKGGSPEKLDQEADDKAPSLSQALQNVFYRLQTADQAVNCKELMKSFGWDTMDAFTQHDAQELNRILCDRLEEQMKGSNMDGSIKRLFEGEMENYIECIDVDYKSRRNETFYDIQLNIKHENGHELRTIEESMREFTAEETLEGDNAYEAEGHGKQRAKKGIRFLTFPPVLNLQLKRFHFDLEKMDMVKLNTRFEFHRKLDLGAFAQGAGTYVLHAVVVHSGDVNSGHYYAFIRPNLEQGWFKFDDDTVTPCSDFAAVEDNYGGNDLAVWNYFDRTPRELRTAQTPTRPRISNAYMLVYVREDCAADVLRVPEPMRINSRMVERCDKEVRVAEQRRRDKMEQQLKIKIRLVLDRDLVKMNGFWDHAEIPHGHTLKLGRDQMVKELTMEVEALTEVPRGHLALFSLHYRNNPRQVRFAFMPGSSMLRSHIPQFSAPHFDTSDPYLTVLCVVAKQYDIQTLKVLPLKDNTKGPDELARWHDEQVTLLIVKYFCPQMRRILTLGCYYIPNQDPLLSMVTDGWVSERIRSYVSSGEIAAPPEDQESSAWECWEEFSERDIQARNVKRQVKSEQLWSGDVIVWQRVSATNREGVSEAGTAAETTNEASHQGEGDAAPTYLVNNVADLAALTLNAIDVVVTLHDSHQPLCVDGVISNGAWGPQRPPLGAAKEGSDAKEEKPEDVALALSPAKFQQPREMEMKMDLRWQLHHVTGSIARAFSIATSAEAQQLWLFHASPSSTGEEPLNAHTSRNEQATLKELQRSATYIAPPAGKKPLALHAVKLPPPARAGSLDRATCPIGVRFYDSTIREVGSCVVVVPVGGTVQDLLTEAAALLQPEWGISGALRALEVIEGRLHKLYTPEAPVRSLVCFGKSNILYHCIRVEADVDAGMPENHRMVEVYHSDRHSQQAFGQPVMVSAAVGEKAGSLKTRCKDILKVPEQEFKSWRLVRCSNRSGRQHLKDDEPWDTDPAPDSRLCLEHIHPNPTSCTRQSRHNKALTIK